MHLNPSVGVGCPFCSDLGRIFVSSICVVLTFRGSVFPFFTFASGVSFKLFIYGPKYSVQRKMTSVLIHFFFLSGPAKLVIWKTRKNKLLGQDAISVVSMFFFFKTKSRVCLLQVGGIFTKVYIYLGC